MQMYSSYYPCVWLGLHQIQMQTPVFAWELKYVSYFTKLPEIHQFSIIQFIIILIPCLLVLFPEHVCTRWYLLGRPSATEPRSLNSTWVIEIALWHTGFLRCGLRDYRLSCSHGTTSNKAFGAKEEWPLYRRAKSLDEVSLPLRKQ